MSNFHKDQYRKRKATETSNGNGGGSLGNQGFHKGKIRKTVPVPDPELKKKIVTDVNIGWFAESRAIEIQALTKKVKDVGGNHLAFQKLPRHMRRRAMSHNIKRVPRRLHEHVRAELDKVKAPNKRPSRKYRRRPSNLLSEYERRKRRIAWLETHIWHAKRFKMIEKWGYRLPLHPNEKSIRACYRALRRHCLLQDVSYESYIEIKGERTAILDGLAHLTSAETGLTFAAQMTSKGTRQGCLMLYNHNSYPHDAIGLVTYLWRPFSNDDNNSTIISTDCASTLWMCCHPAFYVEALREINKCFPTSYANVSVESSTGSDLKNESENNLLENSKNATSHVSNSVVINSLKDQLVKFRLYGPLSTLVLQETLKICHSPDDQLNDESTDIQMKKAEHEGESPEELSTWWKDFYSHKQNLADNRHQVEALKAVMAGQSQSEVPRNSIISAVVKDPRLSLPPHRYKVIPSNSDSSIGKIPRELFNTPAVSTSALWEKDVRHNVKVTKVSEKDLNLMRNKHLIPGTPLDMKDKESRIPILLIQRPGYTHPYPSSSSRMSQSSSSSPLVQEGYAGGWDLLIPSGWSMAFWVALVFRGARVGGQREAHSISLQARHMNQIQDAPDSASGMADVLAQCKEMQLKHDRRPPAKRPNFTKLGFNSPFSLNFDDLCREWRESIQSMVKNHYKDLEDSTSDPTNRDRDISKQSDKFYVLRHRTVLQRLNHILTDTNNFCHITKSSMNGSNEKNPKRSSKTNKSTKSQSSDSLSRFLSDEKVRSFFLQGIDNFSIKLMSLIPVCVRIIHRGVPASRACICLPSKEDLKMFSKDAHFGGPVENLHPDHDAPRRKQERKERLRLRRKKKQGRKSQALKKNLISEPLVNKVDGVSVSNETSTNETDKSEIGQTPPGLTEAMDTTISLKHGGKEELKESTETVKEESDDCAFKTKMSFIKDECHPIIGFVTKGDFNLSQGHGSGMGFCSLAALLKLIAQQGNRSSCLVLVRNLTSTQYRFAKISVVL